MKNELSCARLGPSLESGYESIAASSTSGSSYMSKRSKISMLHRSLSARFRSCDSGVPSTPDIGGHLCKNREIVRFQFTLSCQEHIRLTQIQWVIPSHLTVLMQFLFAFVAYPHNNLQVQDQKIQLFQLFTWAAIRSRERIPRKSWVRGCFSRLFHTTIAGTSSFRLVSTIGPMGSQTKSNISPSTW